MKRDYPRLPWQQFARQLVESGDLDPVYLMLYFSPMPEEQKKRWMMAYWLFYHSGVASDISEQLPDNFWCTVRELYPKCPRGFERRHLRGEAGLKAIQLLEERGRPETIVDWLSGKDSGGGEQTVQQVCERAQSLYLFGPWIAWKVADMLERILKVKINFEEATLLIYDEPRKGAALIKDGVLGTEITAEELVQVCRKVREELAFFNAPPARDRPIGIAEVETVLCKYKAHYKGFYPLYNDSHEIRSGLTGWGDTAESLKQYLPTAPVSGLLRLQVT